MLKDLVFAFRQLRRSPAFTLTAVVTLALGIGANTAIFSLVNSIMLRPLPFPRQDRLVQIEYSRSQTSFFPKGWVRALGEHSESFSSISGFGPDAESNVAAGDSSDRVFGAEVLTNALDALGIHPALGTFFQPEDGTKGRDQVVILSYGYWQQRFAQNPMVLGQTLRIDGVARRIVGVMPAEVRFPYADTQFVTPVAFQGGDPLDPWRVFDLRIFGRLKDGVSPAQAEAELHSLHRSLLPLFPWRMPDIWASEMAVVPLLDAEVGSTRPRLLLLFSAVGLILLIACANVANLMLARAASREREMAVRGALGASTGRLIRQLLSESVLLGFVAGTAGLGVAAASLRGLMHLLPPDTPRIHEVSLDWRTFLFAAAASVLAGFVFGCIPAKKMAGGDLQEGLRANSRGVTGNASHFRLSMFLVIGQIALSVVVITAAGLLLHSLYRLNAVDPGFRTDRMVTAEISLDAGACQVKGRCAAFFSTLLSRVSGMAGTEAVALTDGLPLSGREGNYVYDAEGHPRDPQQGALLATGKTVSSGYFAALGIPLVRGRLLTAQDESGASRAVVINQSMAARLWPNQDPLGKLLLDVNDEPAPATWKSSAASIVVGVVGNTHDGNLAGNFSHQVYLPMTPTREQPVMYVVLRTRAGTAEAAAQLRQLLKEVDPSVPLTRVRSLNEVVLASMSASRSLATLFLAFGALALLIGALGVYSLIAYVVSGRTREIGIRLALGATTWQIVRGVMQQSLFLAFCGTACGLVISALVTQSLRSFLFGVSVLDPATYCAVALLVVALAVFAAWVPARRAAAVDPMDTMRNE
jgi:predicted permease